MSSDAKLPLRELRGDGGASQNNLLMQLQSDILNTRIVRPTTIETTALGAAYLAGLAVNVWKNKSSIKTHWKADTFFRPSMNNSNRIKLLKEWKKTVSNLS